MAWVNESELKRVQVLACLFALVLLLIFYVTFLVANYRYEVRVHAWQSAVIALGNGCEAGKLIVFDGRMYHCYTVNPLSLPRDYK
jgi:hypothetical protein